MTIFLQDTFTDTSSTLLTAHTPDIGGIWQKLASAGVNARIASDGTNQAESATVNTESSPHVNMAAPSGPEYDVSWKVTIQPDTTAFSVYVRMQPQFSPTFDYQGYKFHYDNAASPKLTLVKRVATVDSVIASLDQAIGTGAHTFLFVVRNNIKRVFQDGIELFNSADNVFPDAGLIGISPNSNQRIDNLLASTVVDRAYPVLLSQNFLRAPDRMVAY